MSDKDLFAEAMRKVRPLEQPDKVEISGSKRSTKQLLADTHLRQPIAPPHAGHLQPRRHEPGVLIADGVSRERLKRLAAGQPPAADTIDLHGMTRDEALALLARDFGAAVAAGARALCIIHGRGMHSEGRPVLKEAVYHWLGEGPFAPSVLAAIPQPGSHGGACLVLLRRNTSDEA
ncbi:MAG TPA: Smr/MutS family protein [Mariprofundaceae bacterium]|nr:Smr/MutS family protein [Mariprofundaceae bacterium]